MICFYFILYQNQKKFNYQAFRSHYLILLLNHLFVKTRWLLSGQEELETFQENFRVYTANFPESFQDSCDCMTMLGNFDLNDASSIRLMLKNKNVNFISKYS